MNVLLGTLISLKFFHCEHSEGLPTVTAVIRGPFGRHVWTMQLRHLPRNNKVRKNIEEYTNKANIHKRYCSENQLNSVNSKIN